MLFQGDKHKNVRILFIFATSKKLRCLSNVREKLFKYHIQHYRSFELGILYARNEDK